MSCSQAGSAAAVYHDDRADYTTNEIGIEPAAMGIAMTSWQWR